MKIPLLSGLLLAGACAVAVPCCAQDARNLAIPATSQATELRPAASWKAFVLRGEGAKVQVVTSQDPRFDSVLRATNTRLPTNDYDIQLRAPLEKAIKKGDVILAQFWMRVIETTNESEEGTTTFTFESAGAPYAKSGTYTANVGSEWKLFQVPFVAAGDYAAGGANMIFRLGYQPQTIEIAGFSVGNYAQTVKLADLPRTKYHYAGQELDAPWRREANARIDRLRKADLTVRVVDSAGQPVSGANVRVEMTNSAYKFGAAISARALYDNKDMPPADAAKYAQVFRENFNVAVIENGLKWGSWEGPERRAQTLYTVGWLNGHGIDLRGHNLVWPSWKMTPKELRNLKDDKAALAKAVTDHIADEAGALKGMVTQWDVINETYTNHDLMDVLGRDAMVDWFKAARAADPNARLYINDFAILSGGTRDTEHQRDYEQTIKFLIDKGAPVGGIGLQGHMGTSYTPPEQLLKVLDRFGKFGLPITITELDIGSDDEAAQADYMRDFLTAMFSHATTDGVVMWTFWRVNHWKANASLWRADWTIKPVGEAWQKLVKDEWTTRAMGAADGKGQYQVRGFKGEYRITAQQGGRFAAAEANLNQDGDAVTLVLK